MSNTQSLEKLLSVREKEKNDAQEVYRSSVEYFEEIASKLYHLLKEKETAETSYEKYLGNISPVTTLSLQHDYIERLNKQIWQLQDSVDRARNDMETNQGKLTEAHIEMKKFEKIIEQKQKQYLEKIRYEENKLMDEISATQFSSRINWQ